MSTTATQSKQIRYNSGMEKNSRLSHPILLLGDLLAIALFVFIGQQDHGTGDVNNPIWGVLKASFPFLFSWLVVAVAVRAYPARKDMTLNILLLRGLNAWLIAAPLGLLLRAYLLNRATIPTIFMLLTILVGGAFVLIWRLLFGWVWRYQQKEG